MPIPRCRRTPRGASAATRARPTTRATATTYSTSFRCRPARASTGSPTGSGDASFDGAQGRPFERAQGRLHAGRAARRARDHRAAADDRAAALLRQPGPLQGGGAARGPAPDARRDRQVLWRQGEIPGDARHARLRQVPAQRPGRSHHREEGQLGGGAAPGSAEDRRVRRQERRTGPGERRNRVRGLVAMAARARGPSPELGTGFTYLTILFVVAFMGIGLALTGEVWHTAALREKEAQLLYAG